MTDQTPPKFLKMTDVVERVSLARNTISRLVKSGEFPQPVKLSRSRSAFVEAEINAWMLQRMAATQRGTFCSDEY